MNFKHGYSSHLLYKVWQHIKDRCYNKDYMRYKYYGERGIQVCDEWLDLKTFIEWCLNNGWRKGLEIDRRDNDGNYCPENCRFVTHKENMHNQRLLRSTNTSGYCGVCYHKKVKRWIARITIDSNRKNLGYFNSPELAALAYDNAVPDNRPRNFS